MNSFFKIIRSKIWIFFLLFLIIDFAQSNYHYSNLPMDGDIARVAAPMLWYQDVLDDPIGIRAIKEDVKYSGAGRYVCHRVTQIWFTDVYHFVKKIIKDPVHCLYYTSTLLVLLLHLSFLFLAYYYAKGQEHFQFKKFFLIALLASVLIQYNAYYDCIGILDRSIDYVLFYALPVFVLLIYFIPFYKNQFGTGNKTQIWQHILMLIFAPILAFSGPLIQPLVFIFFMLYVFGVFIKNPFFSIKKNKGLLLQLLFLTICCAYAFFVSQYNSESSEYKPLGERYLLLAKGLARILSLKIAWIVILGALGINTFLVYKLKLISTKKLKAIYSFVFIFCAIYIFLLPLGGYRVYREYIIRYDTFIPVTLGFFFLLFYTTNKISSSLNDKQWKFYLIGVLAFAFIFFNADIKTEREANYCEQGQLYEILESEEEVIRKSFKCRVLIWDVRSIYDVENMKAVNKCLNIWGFTKENQRVEFYEEEPSEK